MLFVTAFRIKFVPVSVIVTSAPGTALPLESLASTTMEPYRTWAWPDAGRSTTPNVVSNITIATAGPRCITCLTVDMGASDPVAPGSDVLPLI